MSLYRRRDILQTGEGRIYEVRLNVGESYLRPPANVKHWTMKVDERGGYWTRLYRAKNREDAVYWLLTWYRNKKYLGKKLKNSIFNSLPQYADEVLEVSDEYDEVVFHPRMKPSLPKNRLLPVYKLNEIIELSKGIFKKTIDFSKRGGFTQTDIYKRERDRNRLIKVPDAPHVYKHLRSNKYHARIQIKSQKTEGGRMEYLGCEKNEIGLYIKTHWNHNRGEVIQPTRYKWVELKATDLKKAVMEAKRLRQKQERGKHGNSKCFKN